MVQLMSKVSAGSDQAVGDLEGFIRRYVVAGDDEIVALMLWATHTHCFEAATVTPYIAVTSATMRSGKSQVLELMEFIVREPVRTSSISPSALFRTIADRRPTLLLDEVDSAGISRDLRAVLNDGYKRGGKVIRAQSMGSFKVADDFPTFCPKMLAGIGKPLPPTVMDRSIPIRLQRRAPDEHVERFRLRDVEEEAIPIKAALKLWGEMHVDLLATLRPEIPPELGDRAAEAWDPLFAIADVIGWGDVARDAAVRLSGTQEEPDKGVQLLSDIKSVFSDTLASRIASADLLGALRSLEDPVFEDDYRRFSTADLARSLKPFAIKPSQFRAGHSNPVRGYDRASFEDSWRRYVVPRSAEM